MEEIKGIIEKKDIASGIGKNGKPFTRWVFTIQGKKYSTFDKLIGDKFNVSDYVVMTGQQNGEYWNMDTMELCSKQENKQLVEEEVKLDNLTQTNDLLRQILAELKAPHYEAE